MSTAASEMQLPKVSASGGVEKVSAASAACHDDPDTDEPKANNKQKSRIHTDPLTGLRGLVSTHIMIGHLVSAAGISVDLMGGASVAMFFVMSGFVMAIGYGRNHTAPPPLCSSAGSDEPPLDIEDNKAGQESVPVFDTWTFWKKRFARLGPVYYVTNLLALPLFYVPFLTTNPSTGVIAGPIPYPWLQLIGPQATNALSIAMAAIGQTAWLGVAPPNVVSWTISTLQFFYLVTPQLLPRVRKLTAIWRWVVGMFFIQLIAYLAFLAVGLYLDIQANTDGFGYGLWAYFMARGFPLTRLPVYIMGLLGGYYALQADPASTTTKTSRLKWARAADGCTSAYVILLGAAAALTSPLMDQWVDPATTQGYVRVAIEGLVPILFVPWIVSYTRAAPDSFPEDESLSGRLFSTKACLWLGQNSYGIYMIHRIVFHYTSQIFFGGEDLGPWWVVLLQLPLALALGYLTTKLVEEPGSRLVLTGSIFRRKQ